MHAEHRGQLTWQLDYWEVDRLDLAYMYFSETSCCLLAHAPRSPCPVFLACWTQICKPQTIISVKCTKYCQVTVTVDISVQPSSPLCDSEMSISFRDQ